MRDGKEFFSGVAFFSVPSLLASGVGDAEGGGVLVGAQAAVAESAAEDPAGDRAIAGAGAVWQAAAPLALVAAAVGEDLGALPFLFAVQPPAGVAGAVAHGEVALAGALAIFPVAFVAQAGGGGQGAAAVRDVDAPIAFVAVAAGEDLGATAGALAVLPVAVVLRAIGPGDAAGAWARPSRRVPS